MALLAYLAVASPRGLHRRDALLPLLWPELDAKRARAALSLTLHRLRKALGPGALPSRGNEEVGLDPDLWAVDVRAFEDALEAGNARSAVEAFGGELMAGFHVDGAPEFERWLDAERRRIRDLATAAAWKVSGEAETRGDGPDAVRWARWVIGTAPDDEPSVRRLIGLLDRLGDRAGALREYERLRAYLREEWDAEPAPETQALIERVVARAEPGPAPEPGRPREAAPVDASDTRVEAAGASTPLAPSSRPRRSRAILLTLGAAAVAALAWAVGLGGPAGDPASPAAQALREGEEAQALGHWPDAVQAYQRAIRADTGFALAYYRLSTAANWTGQADVASQAADAAVERVERLAPRDAMHARAWHAYLRGRPEVAERLYRSLLTEDEDDPWAWFYLAETQFHWGPLLGIPSGTSMEAWTRVVAQRPTDAGAMIHLLRLHARAGDLPAFDALARRLLALDPTPMLRLEVEALRAWVFGGRADRDAVARDLGFASRDVWRPVVRSVAANGGSPDDVIDLARRLTPDEGSPDERIRALFLRAQLEMARGRRRAAAAELTPDAALTPARALEYRTMLLSLPFLPEDRATLEGLRRELTDLEVVAPVGPGMLSLTIQSIYEPNRIYLLGVLGARLGDATDVASRAAELERYEKDTPVDSAFARSLARVLRAEERRLTGDAAGALAALGEPVAEPNGSLPDLLSYAKPHERWLRGELLAELGRTEEALRWFETFPDPGAYDLMYLAPSHRRRADLLATLGRTGEADRHRGLAERLWRDADPEVRRGG